MSDQPDPMGVAERPDTTPMQNMTDRLRGLLVGERDPKTTTATIAAAADMMELQTDWLMDQHRLIKVQAETVTTLNRLLTEANEMVLALLGKDQR
jgi:hypothetical protein